MNAQSLVEMLLGNPVSEASVHRPPRGTIWVAVYTGPQGGQIWRSTRLRDRQQALLVAKKWETEAKAERQKVGAQRKGSIHVRRGVYNQPGELSQKEVAVIMKISERAVREIERRAFAKLRKHPLLRKIWREYVDESEMSLTAAEIAAILRLTKTETELAAIEKALRLIGL